MKKIICLFLCVVSCIGFTACEEKEPETVTLTKDNISDYIFADISFGELNVYDNHSIIGDGQYYITCMATISIKPKGDYIFTDASVSCSGTKSSPWHVLGTSGVDANKFLTSMYILKDIHIDKNGYGETSFVIYCYSDTYDRFHPSTLQWEFDLSPKGGTVTIN